MPGDEAKAVETIKALICVLTPSIEGFKTKYAEQPDVLAGINNIE
ncbi:hypothetical protein KIPB_013078, partial [Kipferlia bialata]|eukprot:g13078.t1